MEDKIKELKEQIKKLEDEKEELKKFIENLEKEKEIELERNSKLIKQINELRKELETTKSKEKENKNTKKLDFKSFLN